MASTSGVHVSCRLRGLAPDEAGSDAASVAGLSSVVVQTAASTSHAFHFDRVFPASASQQEVYDCIGRPCVQDLMLGYHCTILAYGQTCSGKTYTTIGSDDPADSHGLVPRLLEQLFAIADSEEHRGQLSLSASFVEVYQERLRDLLVPIGRSGSSHSSPQLRIREHKASGSVWVDGATDVAVPDLQTARAVVQRGLAQRAVGATRMNTQSSRSHAVFALTITRQTAGDADSSRSETGARLCVVDLAGSEQAKKTQASGTRLDEAKHINKSLSALGNVIHALTVSPCSSSYLSSTSAASYVPYRDSKLTRLLQASLGGNAKTYLLLTCASAACHVEESLSTLRFGARAKQMQNKPTVNRPLTSVPSSERLLATLHSKIESLCRYIQELECRGANNCKRCSGRSESIEQPTKEPQADDDENVEVKADRPQEPTSNDVIMQAEVLELRKALAGMQRLQQHELSHALALKQSVAQAEGVALAQLHERLARDVERLDDQLDDAESQIAKLQEQLRQSQESEQQLRANLRHAEATAEREEAGRDAEAEILRRRMEQLERQAKPLHMELHATRQEALELRRKLEEHSEGEWRRLKEENDAIKKRIHSLQVAAAPMACASSPPPSLVRSKPLLRPMTVASDGSGSPVHSNVIQSWWTGNNGEEEDTVAAEPSRNAAAPLSDHTSESHHSRLETAGLSESGSRERPQLHTSGGSRPFRARLVGLLTSLEEETSSYKELLQAATDEGAPTTSGVALVTASGRSRPSASRSSSHNSRKHRLPELLVERPPRSADEEREKR